MKRVDFIAIAVSMMMGLLSTNANAQDFGRMPEGQGMRPSMGMGMGMQRPSNDAKAIEMADRLDSHLALSKKQYKKIVKHFKKELDYEQELRYAEMRKIFEGMMQQGQGRPEGMRGEGRPEGMRDQGRPDRMKMPELSDESKAKMQKFMEKQDKDLQKILTAEQYMKYKTSKKTSSEGQPQ